MYGYHGQAIVVNLTDRSHRWEPIPTQALRAFIGGIGLGTYLFYRYCPPRVNPLSPDNPLIFVGSSLVGTRLTTSSKFAVMTKSPLTGFIGDSLSSSFLATELKKTCGDALVILGRSATPTLLYIQDGLPQFLDATDLMGLTTSETESAVKDRLSGFSTGPAQRGTVRVASIGPAGEALVRYASIANDGVAAGVGLTREELDYIIRGYYRARGWTGEGLSPEARLKELGLQELLDAPMQRAAAMDFPGSIIA